MFVQTMKRKISLVGEKFMDMEEMKNIDYDLQLWSK